MFKLLIFAGLFAAVFWTVYSHEQVTTTIAEPIYRGNESIKAIALTCNVFWGEEYIDQMLEIFAQESIRITFYIGGTWAEKFPQEVKKIADQGHEIGSHGYGHPHPDNLSVAGNMEDISKAEKIISDITGKKPLLYAPPYGERGAAVLEAAQKLGYQTSLWTVDTIDWQRPAPAVIQERVLTKIENGSIVLMHPTEPTVQALPGIIKSVKEQGYQFITVGTMLKQIADNPLPDK